MSESQECRNCGTPLSGAFCSQCGQKDVPLDPSVATVVRELVQELVNVDGKIFRTTKLLLTRPGLLTREHWVGRRARYVAPFRLYLFFSILFFALNAILPSSVDIPRQQAVTDAAREVGTVWQPRIIFLLVPWFALLVAAAARRAGHHYPAHLYFAMHVLAAWFAVNIPTLLLHHSGLSHAVVISGWLQQIFALSYLILAFRNAYDMGVWSAVWRMVLVFAAYLFSVIASLAALMVFIYLRQ